MSDPFFDSPILNSPYAAPSRHWRLDSAGQPTEEIIDGRRRSSLLTPVPPPRKTRGGNRQQSMELVASGGAVIDGQTYDPNRIINEVRSHVERWRRLNPNQWQVTPETRRLLLHWRKDEWADRRPFFCQIEAVETVIWLTEVAPRTGRGVAGILKHLRDENQRGDPGHIDLPRLACKLATGAGKTTVMAMLIAWQTVNAVRHPTSKLFSRGFLIVAPGITVRDRLRVLKPNDPDSLYRAHDLAPIDLLPDIDRAEVVVTNFHAFQPRERQGLSKGGRELLQGQASAPDTRETDGQMLLRVCPALLGMKRVMVINDEAHHCYREKPAGREEETLKGEARRDAEKNTEAARIWISGLETLASKVRVLRVLDLSATPFFLAGSGYREGTLFPWTMSDFSLLDAIECGIVKLPRVPVADNIPNAEMPVYRNLWQHIGKEMRGVADPGQLPPALLSALDALYGHYQQTFEAWREAGIESPPCFIVVCNNTRTSKLVYDYIAGCHRPGSDDDGEPTFRQGRLPLFCNFADSGESLKQPRTLLIDSVQIESGEALDKNFKAAASDEIERFKRERVQRSGNQADADNISDEDLLREVMNTVGKPGRLGASVRCVVSVAMLTEGWDANTVTHILGVRAFGTQLLCEQVVGRALRRQSYDLNADGRFEVEYADVLGVPFDFTAKPQTVKPPTPAKWVVVEAVSPERDGLAIRFPRVVGYRTALPEQCLTAEFNDDSKLVLTPDLVGPTKTLNEGLIGEGIDLSPEAPEARRRATLVYCLTNHLLERHWPEARGQANRFAELQCVVARWLAECLVCKGGTNARQLAWHSVADMACQKIANGIQAAREDQQLIAAFDPENPQGGTNGVRFLAAASKTLWRTDASKCHLNYAVCDSEWEAEFCRIVESHPRTLAYVKNHNLGFETPYEFCGDGRSYRPDFIVKVFDSHGWDDPLNLVVEIKGQRDEADQAKADGMRTHWVPSVNLDGGFGRWAFAEFTDVHNMEADYHKFVNDALPAAERDATLGLIALGGSAPDIQDIPRRRGRLA